MKVASRILQILALLGAVASGAFYLASLKTSQRDDAAFETLAAQRRAASTRAASLEEELKSLQESSAKSDAARERLNSENLLANSQLLQLRRENLRMAEQLETQENAERRLQKENARLAQELAELKATSVSQDQIARYQEKIAELERSILEFDQTRPPSNGNGLLAGAVIPANPALRGSVLTVGKGASFVVLDIGYSHGVRLQNELYVQHADTPIAKIQVTEVKENLSIARVLPESLVKTPQSGDSVSSPN